MVKTTFIESLRASLDGPAGPMIFDNQRWYDTTAITQDIKRTQQQLSNLGLQRGLRVCVNLQRIAKMKTPLPS